MCRRLGYHAILNIEAIGPIHIVAKSGRLLALEFGDIDHRLMPFLRARFRAPPILEPMEPFGIVAALRSYFAGDIAAIDSIETDAGGTAFQRTAWAALRAIPPGETLSYGTMAAMLGRPNAARAVGSANALNPISLVVPCHRLVGGKGALTGYGGGLERKRWLLDHERRWARQAGQQICANPG